MGKHTRLTMSFLSIQTRGYTSALCCTTKLFRDICEDVTAFNSSVSLIMQRSNETDFSILSNHLYIIDMTSRTLTTFSLAGRNPMTTCLKTFCCLIHEWLGSLFTPPTSVAKPFCQHQEITRDVERHLLALHNCVTIYLLFLLVIKPTQEKTWLPWFLWRTGGALWLSRFFS